MKWMTCALIMSLSIACSEEKPKNAPVMNQGELKAGTAEAEAAAENEFQKTLYQVDGSKGSEDLLALFYQSQVTLSRLFVPSIAPTEETGRCVLVSTIPLENTVKGASLTVTAERTIAYSDKDQKPSLCSQFFHENEDLQLTQNDGVKLISFFSYTF